MCEESGAKLKSITISKTPVDKLVLSTKNAPGTDQGWNDAFELMASSLESLEFDAVHAPGNREHLGPARQISCLGSMSVLRHLKLSVTDMFSSPFVMQDARKICDHLPPSLETVVFCDDLFNPWSLLGTWGSRQLQDIYRQLVKEALICLALHSSEKLPMLKRVSVHAWVESDLSPWVRAAEMLKQHVDCESSSSGDVWSTTPQYFHIVCGTVQGRQRTLAVSGLQETNSGPQDTKPGASSSG